MKEKAEADRILGTYVARARPLFTDLDEETLRAVTENYLILVLYCHPTADVESPEVRLIFDSITAVFHMDDIVDATEDISDLNLTCHTVFKRYPSWKKLFAGEYEEFERFGLFYPILKTGMNYLVDGCKEAEIGIPNFRKKIHYGLKAMFDSMTAIPILLGLHKPGHRFSEESFKLIRGYNAGMQNTLELIIAFSNVEVSEDIRGTILFRSLMDNFNIISGLLNDILGLQKDVKEHLTNDTGILRKVVNEGVLLQVSANAALEALKNAMHDVSVAVELLQISFPEDQHLPTFIQLFKHVYDGQIYSYKAWCKVRYGDIKLTLKKATKAV